MKVITVEEGRSEAPLDGIVLAVNVSPAQTIAGEWQRQPVVTLAGNRVYRAPARIDAAQGRLLRLGETVVLHLE